MSTSQVPRKLGDTSDKKLTPRVGDRVLVTANEQIRLGTVTALGSNGNYAAINIDGWGSAGGFLTSRLEVVGRSLGEWPEGWSDYDEGYVLHEPSNVAIDKDNLKQLLATGPDMLERWDELVGGS
jgi:hypothetical protein